MKLEEKLFSLRKAKGLSQMKLAEIMNVSRQAISRWEVGAAVPSTDNLKFLGRLYNVPLEYLLHDDAPDPVPQEPDEKVAVPGIEKRWILIFVAIMATVVVFLCIVLLRDEPKKSMQMDEIERSEVETDNTNDFELEF
ncbi:helix-turn-helix domain-containing protein [Lawsonibacter sp. LCP25S3_G6]|uniref:helix-turn-helix domain-containing protein n=3 Tax=Lawsonibacter TaxID=2172004 RepID=UPI003F978F69